MGLARQLQPCMCMLQAAGWLHDVESTRRFGIHFCSPSGCPAEFLLTVRCRGNHGRSWWIATPSRGLRTWQRWDCPQPVRNCAASVLPLRGCRRKQLATTPAFYVRKRMQSMFPDSRNAPAGLTAARAAAGYRLTVFCECGAGAVAIQEELGVLPHQLLHLRDADDSRVHGEDLPAGLCHKRHRDNIASAEMGVPAGGGCGSAGCAKRSSLPRLRLVCSTGDESVEPRSAGAAGRVVVLPLHRAAGVHHRRRPRFQVLFGCLLTV